MAARGAGAADRKTAGGRVPVSGSLSGYRNLLIAFRKGLAAFGHVEGQNVAYLSDGLTIALLFLRPKSKL
jgi:hypothetical protein